jgi:hypothetical protein
MGYKNVMVVRDAVGGKRLEPKVCFVFFWIFAVL